jgi:hypothetical protein
MSDYTWSIELGAGMVHSGYTSSSLTECSCYLFHLTLVDYSLQCKKERM